MINITEEVSKHVGFDDVCTYLIMHKDMNILIDAGNSVDKENLIESLGIDSSDIHVVLFTHLHYDHCGNWDQFPNAKLYASKKEIENLQNENLDIGDVNFKKLLEKIIPLKQNIVEGITYVTSPGHTEGSVMYLYKTKSGKTILFSGDTLFRHGMIGRTDLLSSNPQQMRDTLDNLRMIKYDLLCPGHDY